MRTLPPPLRRPLACGLALAATLAAAGCTAADGPTAPAAASSTLVPGAVASVAGGHDERGWTRRRGPGRRLLACRVAAGHRADAVVGPQGGTLSLGDVTVTLPPGAVAEPQHFTLSFEPGRVLAVDVHATGHDHYQFRRPVTITIGFGHCGAVQGTLTAWHVDGASGDLLEHMGGVTDPDARTHSFATSHLSVYALAN